MFLTLLGLWRTLDWGFINWKLYAWVINVPMYICLTFQSHILNIRVQRTILSLMSSLGLWMTLELPDWSCITWKVYKWVIYIFMYLFLKFQSHILNIRVQRTLLSAISLFGFWRKLEVLDWNFLPEKYKYGSRTFKWTCLSNFSFLHLLWSCQEPSCLSCLPWGCGGHWSFLTGVSVPEQHINWSYM